MVSRGFHLHWERYKIILDDDDARQILFWTALALLYFLQMGGAWRKRCVVWWCGKKVACHTVHCTVQIASSITFFINWSLWHGFCVSTTACCSEQFVREIRNGLWDKESVVFRDFGGNDYRLRSFTVEVLWPPSTGSQFDCLCVRIR